MRILLTAATRFEIEPFLSRFTNADVLIAGVGVPSTLYQLQKKLQEQPYDLVIQAGIGGRFNNSVLLGDVVNISADCFADIGMEEKKNFVSIFDTGFADKNEFPYTDGWLQNPYNIPLDIASVKSVTVNRISDSQLQTQQYIQLYDAVIESMEGAALHYVCLQQKVSFIQLRAVSNDVGDRNKQNWKIKDAIINLNQTIEKLYDHFTAINK